MSMAASFISIVVTDASGKWCVRIGIDVIHLSVHAELCHLKPH